MAMKPDVTQIVTPDSPQMIKDLVEGKRITRSIYCKTIAVIPYYSDDEILDHRILVMDNSDVIVIKAKIPSDDANLATLFEINTYMKLLAGCGYVCNSNTATNPKQLFGCGKFIAITNPQKLERCASFKTTCGPYSNMPMAFVSIVDIIKNKEKGEIVDVIGIMDTIKLSASTRESAKLRKWIERAVEDGENSNDYILLKGYPNRPTLKFNLADSEHNMLDVSAWEPVSSTCGINSTMDTKEYGVILKGCRVSEYDGRKGLNINRFTLVLPMPQSEIRKWMSDAECLMLGFPGSDTTNVVEPLTLHSPPKKQKFELHTSLYLESENMDSKLSEVLSPRRRRSSNWQLSNAQVMTFDEVNQRLNANMEPFIAIFKNVRIQAGKVHRYWSCSNCRLGNVNLVHEQCPNCGDGMRLLTQEAMLRNIILGQFENDVWTQLEHKCTAFPMLFKELYELIFKAYEADDDDVVVDVIKSLEIAYVLLMFDAAGKNGRNITICEMKIQNPLSLRKV